MATSVMLCPDMVERYTTPSTPADGNLWLQRVGASHLKFGTSKGEAVLRTVADNTVRLRAKKVRDLCVFLAYQPLQMRHFGISFYDFYIPRDYKLGQVTICMTTNNSCC